MNRTIFLAAILFILGLAPLCASTAADMLVGVTAHVLGNRTDIGRLRAHAIAAGMKSLRVEPYWDAVEKEKGQLALPPELYPLEDLIAQTAADGVHPLVILDYGNPHYDGGSYPVSDEAQEGFVRYAQYIANRFKGQVRYYEVWNEWNAGTGISRPPKYDQAASASNYARLFRKTYDAIKQIDPDAKVITGGLAHRDTGWLLRVLAQSGRLPDGVSLNPYNFSEGEGASGDADKPEEVMRWLDSLDEAIRTHTGARIPFFITEIGWPNHVGKTGVSETASAQYLVRILLLSAQRANIMGVLWYDYQDDGVDPANPEDHFGLLTRDGVAKPVLAAMADTTRLIRTAIDVRPCGVAPPLMCLAITSRDNLLTHVLWVSTNAHGNVIVSAPSLSVDILISRIDGSSAPRVFRTEPNATSLIPVSGMPLMIRAGNAPLGFQFIGMRNASGFHRRGAHEQKIIKVR